MPDSSGRPENGAGENLETRWRAFVVASIPLFIDLHLQPHVRMLVDMGFDVTVMSSGEPEIAAEVSYEEVPFTRSPITFWKHPPTILKMRKLIGSATPENPVLLHLHTPTPALLSRLAIPRKKRDCVKVVYLAHGFHFQSEQRNLYWFLERLVGSKTDQFIVLNTEDEKAASQLGGGAVSVLPGVGSRRLTYANRPVGSRNLVVVGILEERKRPQLALEALALLPDDVTMTFCGSGPLEGELMTMAGELGVSDRVTFAGWVDDPNPFYEKAASLVFLSEREGLPMAVIEALAAGLGVVAFDIRGVRDIMSGLDCWRQPASLEPSDVSAAILASLENEHRLVESHERAAEFSIEASTTAHQRIVSDVVARSGLG